MAPAFQVQVRPITATTAIPPSRSRQRPTIARRQWQLAVCRRPVSHNRIITAIKWHKQRTFRQERFHWISHSITYHSHITIIRPDRMVLACLTFTITAMDIITTDFICPIQMNSIRPARTGHHTTFYRMRCVQRIRKFVRSIPSMVSFPTSTHKSSLKIDLNRFWCDTHAYIRMDLFSHINGLWTLSCDAISEANNIFWYIQHVPGGINSTLAHSCYYFRLKKCLNDVINPFRWSLNFSSSESTDFILHYNHEWIRRKVSRSPLSSLIVVGKSLDKHTNNALPWW